MITYHDNFYKKDNSLLDYDPVYFIENNLKIDGENFNILENGWKFMADVYRYIAIQATKKDEKPVIIKKGRQVGATTIALALDLYFTNNGLFANSPIKVAHIFPTIPLRNRFIQEKLENMIRDSKDNFINKKNIDKNLKVVSLDTEYRVRGMTVDIIFFDEIQDMSKNAIIDTTKILKLYKNIDQGACVYLGTPKDKNNFLEESWEQSDQRYYHLGCPSCKKTFPFYTPNSDNWKMIWPEKDVIICPLCSYKTNKNTAISLGKWVSLNKENTKFVGFHINQLYIPYFSREHINNVMPENNPNQSEMAWNNEVIGEFYE